MRNITKSIRRWRAIRQTEFELMCLTDRELNDLGLARGDIPNAARKAADREFA
ncbi:MAG: DUF1127 domain-containing protein [Pseudomonadota bacterium]